MKISWQCAPAIALMTLLSAAVAVAWRMSDPKADDEKCAFALMGDLTSSHRYSGYSRFRDGEERGNGGAPGRGWMAAEPWQFYHDDEASTIRAFNDRTYYLCGGDDSDPSTLLWFSEIRSATLTRLLSERRARSTGGDAIPPVFVPADDPEDANSKKRIRETLRFLGRTEGAYKAMVPPWWPEAGAEISLAGWFDQGILLKGQLPDQYFYVNVPGGFTGPMDSKGACQDGVAGVLCKQSPLQYLTAAPVTVASSGSVDAARRQMSNLLRATRNPDERKEVVATARGIIEQMAGRSETCDALIMPFLKTDDARRSSFQQTDAGGQSSEHGVSGAEREEFSNEFVNQALTVLEASFCGPF